MSQVSQIQGNWDIYDENGRTLITFKTFVQLDFKAEANAPSQPVEENGFATYNKVVSPHNITVILGIEGTELFLGQQANIINEQLKSATLVQVSTPTGLLPLCTVVSFDFTRKAENGLGVLWVNLKLQEVRQVKKEYTDTTITQKSAARASDVSPTEGGMVQTKDPKESVLEQIKVWATS